MTARQTFAQVFRERLQQIEEDARKVGINMTVVCREAGVGRATPDRWHRETPQTIKLIDRMEAVIERHRKSKVQELKT